MATEYFLLIIHLIAMLLTATFFKNNFIKDAHICDKYSPTFSRRPSVVLEKRISSCMFPPPPTPAT